MAGINTDQVNSHKLLLHLSDIHFREPHCLNLETDQDHPVRMALLNDLRDMVEKLGSVDAILISGDVAFKGHRDEYEVAAEWLSKIASAVGCTKSGIYVVPGNHDINRNTAGGRIITGLREGILKHPSGAKRDEEIYGALYDERSGAELLTPMDEYNLFAASYGCDLNSKLPFWIQNLSLAPGWALKMHGLTTTYFSGPDDDERGSLYLGAFQRSFAPSDGIVRLAMMHHPPDWLADQDDFDDALWNGCAIQLMGHKHRNRYFLNDAGIRLAAGAVSPSRTEANWEPGYNLINLQIIQDNDDYFLKIESHLRLWQDSPNRFIAKRSKNGRDVFEFKMRLLNKPLHNVNGNSEIKFTAENGSGGLGMNQQSSLINDGDEDVMIEVKNNPEAPSIQRDIVFKFWGLSPSQRRKIMQNFNLLEQADDQLHETLRYRRAFERARDRKMINELKEVINQIFDLTGSYKNASIFR